jgi:hypothetical protein
MLSELIQVKIAELSEQLENLTFDTSNTIQTRAGKNPLNLRGIFYFSIGFWFLG